jgi:hypothetical protein
MLERTKRECIVVTKSPSNRRFSPAIDVRALQLLLVPLLVLVVVVLLLLLLLLLVLAVVLVLLVMVLLLLMLLMVALLVGVPLLFGSPFFCVWPFEIPTSSSPSSPSSLSSSLSWVGGFDFAIAEQAPSQFGAAVLLL